MFLGGLKLQELFSTKWHMYPEYKPDSVNPCSVDVTLGNSILRLITKVIDPCDPDSVSWKEVTGTLYPGELYLGCTVERFDCSAPVDGKCYFQCIEGKSTLARLGISIHETAGWGDYGFQGAFTLEISVKKPTILYPGMPIAQVCFAEVENPFSYEGHYSGEDHYSKPVTPVLGKRFRPVI